MQGTPVHLCAGLGARFKLSGVHCADTRDVAGTVEQVKRCVDAGAEIVRITVQGKKEAAACMDIREALFKDGCVASVIQMEFELCFRGG